MRHDIAGNDAQLCQVDRIVQTPEAGDSRRWVWHDVPTNDHRVGFAVAYTKWIISRNVKLRHPKIREWSSLVEGVNPCVPSGKILCFRIPKQ